MLSGLCFSFYIQAGLLLLFIGQMIMMTQNQGHWTGTVWSRKWITLIEDPCIHKNIVNPYKLRRLFVLPPYFCPFPLLMCEITLWSKGRVGRSFNESPRNHKVACACNFWFVLITTQLISVSIHYVPKYFAHFIQMRIYGQFWWPRIYPMISVAGSPFIWLCCAGAVH